MKTGAILYDSSKFAPVLISLHIYWTFGNAPGDSVPFTVSRRNWLFSAPKGAEISAIVYTMVEIAKAHGLNIYKYLNHLLEHLPGTRMTDRELSRLAPWDPEVTSKCSGAMQSKVKYICLARSDRVKYLQSLHFIMQGLLYFVHL